MEELPMLPEAHVKRTCWQRFIDKLAGGPPDPEKIEAAKRQGWFKQYLITQVLIATTCVSVIYPEVVSQLNDAPDPSQLRTVQVRILKTRATEPHFRVQMPGGGELDMEWPVVITFRGGFKFYQWSDEQQAGLVGCSAIVQFEPMRWTFSKRYRVWSISCPSENFTVDLRRAVEIIRSDLLFGIFFFAIKMFICLLVTVIFFVRERRGIL